MFLRDSIPKSNITDSRAQPVFLSQTLLKLDDTFEKNTHVNSQRKIVCSAVFLILHTPTVLVLGVPLGVPEYQSESRSTWDPGVPFPPCSDGFLGSGPRLILTQTRVPRVHRPLETSFHAKSVFDVLLTSTNRHTHKHFFRLTLLTVEGTNLMCFFVDPK